jgi:hypothetical protein
MEKCPVCIDGRMLTKISSAGEETFCVDCRRIVKSAAFNFEFKVAASDEGISECSIPGNPNPGVKGPGKKARCFTYDPSNEDAKIKAHQKARNSAYAAQHKKAASRIVNAVAYFTGAPEVTTGSNPTMSQSSALPQDAQDLSFTTQQNDIGKVTAPGGEQMGDLNQSNPLNSGTTSSKKLAELIEDDVKNHMGRGFCTEHMDYDGCNPDRNLQ